MVDNAAGRVCLAAVAVVLGDEEGVTLDRDHELGEVAVADDPSELLLGDEHPGGGSATLAHVAVPQRSTLRCV